MIAMRRFIRPPAPRRRPAQKKAPPERGLKSCLSGFSGDRLDPGGLRALRALGDFVLDALSLLQAAEALGVDRRIMDEHIRAAVFRRDEPEPLGVVEPLHCAVLHDSSNLVMAGGARSAIQQPPSPDQPSMQSIRGVCNHRARSADTSAGMPAEAAATFASTSSRVMVSSGSGPAPAAQLATIARQA